MMRALWRQVSVCACIYVQKQAHVRIFTKSRCHYLSWALARAACPAGRWCARAAAASRRWAAAGDAAAAAAGPSGSGPPWSWRRRICVQPCWGWPPASHRRAGGWTRVCSSRCVWRPSPSRSGRYSRARAPTPPHPRVPLRPARRPASNLDYH